jgi:hypothetical protein
MNVHDILNDFEPALDDSGDFVNALVDAVEAELLAQSAVECTALVTVRSLPFPMSEEPIVRLVPETASCSAAFPPLEQYFELVEQPKLHQRKSYARENRFILPHPIALRYRNGFSFADPAFPTREKLRLVVDVVWLDRHEIVVSEAFFVRSNARTTRVERGNNVQSEHVN